MWGPSSVNGAAKQTDTVTDTYCDAVTLSLAYERHGPSRTADSEKASGPQGPATHSSLPTASSGKAAGLVWIQNWRALPISTR